jgi:hypothetical protein
MKMVVPEVPKPCMLEVGVTGRQEGVAGESFIGGGAQWVEFTERVTSKQNYPRFEILD